jgi:hypothetical protein
MAVDTPRIKGLTTISWGTLLQLGTPAGAIVESISITPKNGEPIGEIENGDGAAVALILLVDGFQAKVKVTYDTAKTWPAEGDAINLTLPKIGAAGGTTVFACGVVAMAPETARKKEAMIEITILYRPGITWP